MVANISEKYKILKNFLGGKVSSKKLYVAKWRTFNHRRKLTFELVKEGSHLTSIKIENLEIFLWSKQSYGGGICKAFDMAKWDNSLVVILDTWLEHSFFKV